MTGAEGLSGAAAAGWFTLLMAMVAAAGWLAGSAAHIFGALVRRCGSAGRRRIMWMHFLLIALMLGYYSHVFLPVLLVSAHSAWLHQRSRRLRMEKKRDLLAAMLRMRRQAAQPAS